MPSASETWKLLGSACPYRRDRSHGTNHLGQTCIAEPSWTMQPRLYWWPLKKESGILNILLLLAHHLSYLDSIRFKDDLKFCRDPNLIQELDSVSLKNVRTKTGLKNNQTPSFDFLPTKLLITWKLIHAVSTGSTTPTSITQPTWSVKDHLAKASWLQVSRCLLRTIQGWPSWKGLFARSTRSWNEWANILRRVLRK